MSGVGSRRRAAELFVQQWAGHGYEKGETHSFWLSLLQDVLGMREVSTRCRFEQRTRAGGFIDVVIPAVRTIVEQKSSGVNLDRGELRQGQMVTPFQQAKRYADALPNRQRPDFIIVCNFECFRLHDLNKDDPAGDYIEFSLAELPEQSYLLDFLIDPAYSRTEKERKVSIRAGQLIGKLHRGLLEQYQDPDSAWSQHCLNVLCVRLVFCLFAEDAGLFGKDALLRYLRGFTASQTRGALQRLFQVLDTPLEQRDPYLEEELAVFPYVNGGLFRDSAAGTGVATRFDDGEDALAGASAGDGATVFPSSLAGETGRALEIPNFTEELCDLLLNEVSQGTDWSQISPTVFGGVFESTLNPETRRSGGMHYTSPENIHRVIDPLFLDGLKNELEGILSDPGISDRSRRAKLRAFQNRLASFTWLDSACGSGNFLTETYIEVRRLENQVIAELERGQQAWEFEQEGAATNQIKVNLGQFYGIEINDFAVAVARTALWIAELQANGETAAILQREVADLPLHDDSNIVLANAIRMDWEQLLPAEKCSFLISNPPFIGYSNHSPEQKQDRANLFGKRGGVLDYVACWYQKAADYMRGTQIRAAFVSTNSICQGQQVTPLWRPLFEDGIRINFAHRSFVWGNEAENQAHVHVVIIGFSYQDEQPKYLFEHPKEGESRRYQVEHINGYLTAAPDVFVDKQMKPLSDVPYMAKGFQPTDGQNLLLSAQQRDELLAKEPAAEKWIRPFSMGAEFIKGIDRYCLWLPQITGAELKKVPEVRKHIEACRAWREQQTPTGDAYKLADRAHLLRPCGKFRDGTYLGFPKVSSERRRYIPIGFVTDGMIPGDKLYFVPTADIYHFGVLTSQFHNAWMRVVAGRLKSDYSYGNTTVYNTFIWPDPTPQQKRAIEEAAALVLEKRKAYAPATLAELYDPDNDFLYPELIRAHAQLDRAVEAAYGVDFAGDEAKITAHLFTLYQAATMS